MATRDVYLLSAMTLTVATSWACSPSGKARAPDWKRVPVSLELRLAEGSPAPGLVPAMVYGQGKTVYLPPEAQLSKSDIARVEAVKTRIGKGLILQVWLTRAGATRIKETTGRHIGDSLAVLIDSVVVAVPIIQQAIGSDPKLPIDIGVPLEPKEAQQLAAAVAETWPPAPPPSGRKVRKDSM
jgi:preprotein translocase subunit SecD